MVSAISLILVSLDSMSSPLAILSLTIGLFFFDTKRRSICTEAEIVRFSAYDFQIIQQRGGLLGSCAFYDKQTVIQL